MTAEKITVPMSKADLLDKLARIMRDRAYPEFGLAPPPLWASDAAQTILTLFEDLTKLTLASPTPLEGLRTALQRKVTLDADAFDDLFLGRSEPVGPAPGEPRE